jgi:hypothetical protein
MVFAPSASQGKMPMLKSSEFVTWKKTAAANASGKLSLDRAAAELAIPSESQSRSPCSRF